MSREAPDLPAKPVRRARRALWPQNPPDAVIAAATVRLDQAADCERLEHTIADLIPRAILLGGISSGGEAHPHACGQGQ